MKEILNIIKSFNEDYVSYYPPISNDGILKAEKFINAKLPEDYIDFLKFSNGITIAGDEVLGIHNKEYDLIRAYEIEHKHVEEIMYSNIVPFFPDGGGNFYCFDLRLKNIIFWVSNYKYTEDDKPEVVNNSFTEWFKEVMIDWTIENIGDDIFKRQ